MATSIADTTATPSPDGDDLAVEPPPLDPKAPPRPSGKFRKRGRFTMWFAIVWLGFLTFTAIGANWLPYVNHSCSQFDSKVECSTHVIGTPLKIERPPAWAGFSSTTKPVVPGSPPRTGFFGTDTNGYDLFSRAMFGARTSLLIAFLATVFGILIGGLLGLLSGYLGKRTDSVINTVGNVLLAFPALLLAIFIVGFFTDSSPDKAQDRSITPIICALVILSIAPIMRLVRGSTISFAQRDFVTASRSLGASKWRVMSREILPNVMPALLTFAFTAMALIIVAEGALAYLGLSVNSPNPTWGAMIYAGQTKLGTAWWISIMPAVTMFLTILSINFLGDVVAEKFRVREAIG